MTQPASAQAPTRNPHLTRWVEEMGKLTRPDQVVWCDGSEAEKERLTGLCVKEGILHPLNQEKWPGCYLHRSNPNDVARMEHLTFICTRQKEDAGPFNNWMAPDDAYGMLTRHFEGSMKGRTLYVIPYVMGPVGSPFSKVGVELTDSPYVVLNMRIMTRMGKQALDMLGDSNDFNRGLHCTGDVNPERRWIAHFPEDNTIWSFGSGYGGNVLLGKKCLALRIGSYLGRQEGWLAEHMLILGVESPTGQVDYVAAAFPSACGKTNFAMMIPPRRFNGWKITTVGDDIAWMRVGPDGRLWAINPEAGYFGVVPGTNNKSNANAMKTITRDTIFTNVAVDPATNEPWWEDKDGEVPERLIDWRGNEWKKGSTEKAAHPNSRFTSPATNNPALNPRYNDPMGVPISAIVFGGRRSTTVPLVMQAFNWGHGVYLGATMGSETTAAATGKVGVVRRDPMAMLPFHGYDMGTYLQHWLNMQHKIPYSPKIFQVNWFRKGKEGNFLWPGFGDNMRILKWILDRVHGRIPTQETLLGWVPREGDIDLQGMDVPEDQVQEALHIDLDEWQEELTSQGEFFEQLGKTAPETLLLQRKLLLSRLASRAPTPKA